MMAAKKITSKRSHVAWRVKIGNGGEIISGEKSGANGGVAYQRILWRAALTAVICDDDC